MSHSMDIDGPMTDHIATINAAQDLIVHGLNKACISLGLAKVLSRLINAIRYVVFEQRFFLIVLRASSP